MQLFLAVTQLGIAHWFDGGTESHQARRSHDERALTCECLTGEIALIHNEEQTTATQTAYLGRPNRCRMTSPKSIRDNSDTEVTLIEAIAFARVQLGRCQTLGARRRLS